MRTGLLVGDDPERIRTFDLLDRNQML